MSLMTETPQASWAVQSQLQQTKIGPTGTLQDGYDVTFTTGEGHTGTVFVPMNNYTPDKVRALVQAQANLLDSIGQLSSEGGAG